MGTHTNVIEINGTTYDAVSGVVVRSQNSTTVVDGIVRRSKDTHTHRQVGHSAVKLRPKPQKSTTLMRSAVKKPHTLHVLDVQKPKPSVPLSVHNKNTIAKKSYDIPEQRKQRAELVVKSEQIKKFSATQSGATSHINLTEIRPTPLYDNSIEYSRPSHIKKADLLEKAMQAAQGHNEPAYKHKEKLHHKIAKKIGISGRAVAITSTVLAGVLVGGFYAYQNVPKLAVRVASNRAGIKASIPTYSPAGFSINGPIQYRSGQVVVGFKSNIDERNYTLTQQNTSWSSDTLLDNFLVNNKKQYQTYQDKGRTIYIYDTNNATWIDDGIWYQIEGQSQLSSDQLVRIASSL